MKKLYLSLIILLLTFCMTGCGDSQEQRTLNQMVNAPGTSESYVGESWITVFDAFSEAGFTNITTEELKDIDGSVSFEENDIECVIINGDSDYSVDTEYSPDVPVVLTYHTLAEFNAKIHVDFKSNLLFNKYDVDFLVDGDKAGTLEHGEDGDYEITLTYGKHILSFVSVKDDDDKGEIELDVKSNLDASYKISCKGNEVKIEVEFVEYHFEPKEGEIKIAKSSDEFAGAYYEEVMKAFVNMGFTNINAQPIYDIKTQVSNDGKIELISIDGNTEFMKDDIFPSDAEVIVKYHTLVENDPKEIARKEKEAEEKKAKLKTAPISSYDCEGKNYVEIEKLFKEAGFKVALNPVEQNEGETSYKDGDIIIVSAGDQSMFEKDEELSTDIKITIHYCKLIKAEKEEEKTEEKKTAEEKLAEETPTEEKPTEEKPTEEKPTEEKSTEQKPTEEKPTEQKPAEQEPVDSKPVYSISDMNETMYASANVNVRSNPDAESNKIGSLANGNAVTVTGHTENGWYRINYNGGSGFVKDDYLSKNTSTSGGTSSGESSSSGDSTHVTVPKTEDSQGNLVWVPTNGGKKYHSKSSCSNMNNPMQITKEHAEANGYTPCQRCH